MNVQTEDRKVIPFDQKDNIEISEHVDPETIKEVNPLEAAINALGEVDPEMGDLESFALMLQLPDELLKNLEPILMEEIEKAMSNSNSALEIATALNIAELTQEDLAQYTELLFQELETQLGDQLTEYKISFLKKFFATIFNSAELGKTVAQRMIQIPIEKCHPDAVIPSYARLGDAGLDLYALDDYTIMPGETKLIPTGLKVAIPQGYELQVRPKSGRALKTKLRVANTPGTIDSGYRDEIGVIIENIEAPIKDITYDFAEDGHPIITSILHGEPFYINKGEKFAQLVLSTVPTARFFVVDSVAEIGQNRGGGFGSTGLKEDNV